MIAKSVVFQSPGPLTSLQIIKHIVKSPTVIKILVAPINPSDINMIQGTYPILPRKYPFGYVAGQEGLGQVIEGKNEGKLVLPISQSFNTWQTHASVKLEDTIVMDESDVSKRFMATVAVNPSSAYRMLKGFVELNRGDTCILNCGNSGVGRAVLGICKAWGIKTVATIRSRETVGEGEEIKKDLYSLGADLVLFEEEVVKRRKEIYDIGVPKLGLNGAGGESATNLARLLGDNGVLVTYGGMSRKPVSLPTSLFIFKNITCKGFWLSKWFEERELKARLDIYKELFDLARDGYLNAPPGEDISMGRVDSSVEEDVDLLAKIARVSRKKKFLISADFCE